MMGHTLGNAGKELHSCSKYFSHCQQALKIVPNSQTSVIFTGYSTVGELENRPHFPAEQIELRKVPSASKPPQSDSAKISGRDEPELLFLRPRSGVCPPNPVLITCCPFWVPGSVSKFMIETQNPWAADQPVGDPTGDRKTPAWQASCC